MSEQPMQVRVRFNRNVLGRRAGTVDWVEATPIVERLVINKYLTWLDRPVENPVETEQVETVVPEKPKRQRAPRKPKLAEVLDEVVERDAELLDRLADGPESNVFEADAPEDAWFTDYDRG